MPLYRSFYFASSLFNGGLRLTESTLLSFIVLYNLFLIINIIALRSGVKKNIFSEISFSLQNTQNLNKEESKEMKETFFVFLFMDGS